MFYVILYTTKYVKRTIIINTFAKYFQNIFYEKDFVFRMCY